MQTLSDSLVSPLIQPLSGLGAASSRVVASGHAPLDDLLREGGWPLGVLIELFVAAGSAELSLLAPALRQALQRPGWLVLVSPPGVPHIPAWQAGGLAAERLLVLRPASPRDWLWSVDQAARAGMPAVLAWPGRVAMTDKTLRRLQLAAEAGGGMLILCRRPSQAQEISPAALRIALQTAPSSLELTLLKQRGHWAGQAVRLALPLATESVPPVAAWSAMTGRWLRMPPSSGPVQRRTVSARMPKTQSL